MQSDGALLMERHCAEDTSTGDRPRRVTRFESGVRMRLYPDSHLCQAIHAGGYESAERAFLRAFLRPGDVFVDVGAHYGLYALLAARCVGAGGQVYAFEPCAKTFRRLLSNVSLNGLSCISCHQVALSDRPGWLGMTVALDGFEACNSLAHPVSGDRFASETVACITWDRFAREHALIGRVTMIKIDVEGWEPRVLAGARDTLARPDAPVLQVEFVERALQSAGCSCAALRALLEGLGYEVFAIRGAQGAVALDSLAEGERCDNLIAAKQWGLVAERIGQRLASP